MLSDVPGIAVGHWTDFEAKTGCTVIVLPEGATASGEIRGGSPATREFGLLEPTKAVAAVDAVVLSGGSAHGLAAADGVMERLESAGRGFPTRFGRVPIVVGMSLYDLGVGDSGRRPGPIEGGLAYDAATVNAQAELGRIGAGVGATVDKWSGEPKPGGIGAATVTARPRDGVDVESPIDTAIMVSAMVAVNAFGAIDHDGQGDPGPPSAPAFDIEPETNTNTTIGCIATNASLDKVGCQLLAQAGHDGLARALRPAHTPVDGDALVAVSTGEVEIDGLWALMYLKLLAEQAVTRATRSVA